MDQNINRDTLLNTYLQQIGRENIIGKKDATSQVEELDEVDPLLLANLKSAEKSPFSRDIVILSPSAQKFLELLRERFPIDPYIFLHTNYIKNVSLGKSINIVVDKITKGYKMLFALTNKKY